MVACQVCCKDGARRTPVIRSITMEEDDMTMLGRALPLLSWQIRRIVRTGMGGAELVRVDDPSTHRLASAVVSTSLRDIGRPGFDLWSGHYSSTKVVLELCARSTGILKGVAYCMDDNWMVCSGTFAPWRRLTKDCKVVTHQRMRL